jgi:carbon monoxide dehydrogenase subunit G
MSMMSNKRSIHIEAPVEKVFDFFKDPKNWEELPNSGRFEDVTVTEEGLGTFYRAILPIPGIRIESFDVYTEFVPNQRITDRSSWAFFETMTWSFEPEGAGTKLTWEGHPGSFWRVPLLKELAERGMAMANRYWMPALKAYLEAKPEGKLEAKPKGKTAA